MRLARLARLGLGGLQRGLDRAEVGLALREQRLRAREVGQRGLQRGLLRVERAALAPERVRVLSVCGVELALEPLARLALLLEVVDKLLDMRGELVLALAGGEQVVVALLVELGDLCELVLQVVAFLRRILVYACEREGGTYLLHGIRDSLQPLPLVLFVEAHPLAVLLQTIELVLELIHLLPEALDFAVCRLDFNVLLLRLPLNVRKRCLELLVELASVRFELGDLQSQFF